MCTLVRLTAHGEEVKGTPSECGLRSVSLSLSLADKSKSNRRACPPARFTRHPSALQYGFNLETTTSCTSTEWYRCFPPPLQEGTAPPPLPLAGSPSLLLTADPPSFLPSYCSSCSSTARHGDPTRECAHSCPRVTSSRWQNVTQASKSSCVA